MRIAEELGSSDTSRPLALVLPGKLDHAEYPFYEQLGQAAEDAGYRSVILDMYSLDGVVEDPEEPGSYICEWRPSDVLRSIDQTIRNLTNQPATLIAYSYLAQSGYRYSAVAEPFNLAPVNKMIGIMPTNYWHWGEYDPEADLSWMIRQYKKYGRIDLGVTRDESRSPTNADQIPGVIPHDGHRVRITRRTVSDHLMPLDGLLPADSPLPVGDSGLTQSGLLRRVEQQTLTVSGTYDTLTPDATDRVRAIYEGLSRRGSHDYVEAAVQHDCRLVPEQVDIIGRLVTGWLSAA